MKRNMGRALVFWGVIAAAIVLNGISGASAADDACSRPPAALGKFQAATDGKTLPDAAYVTADGSERPMTALRGKPLIVNFWATWCAPCVKEMPALDALAAQSADGGPAVLALSWDREGAAIIAKFYAVNTITHLPVAQDKLGRVGRAVGVEALPTTVLYRADGREAGRVQGTAEWDDPAVRAFLRSCLGAGTAPSQG